MFEPVTTGASGSIMKVRLTVCEPLIWPPAKGVRITS